MTVQHARPNPHAASDQQAAPDLPAAAPPSRYFDELVWWLWPLMAWLYPVALFLIVNSTGAGGWDALFLLIASPAVLPIIALLNLLPRRLARKRLEPNEGAGSPVLSLLLLLHWWGLAMFAMFYRGAGDSGGGVDSVMHEAFFWLPREIEGSLCLLGAALAFLSWILLLMIAAAGPVEKHMATTWYWVAALTPPMLVALTMVVAHWLIRE